MSKARTSLSKESKPLTGARISYITPVTYKPLSQIIIKIITGSAGPKARNRIAGAGAANRIWQRSCQNRKGKEQAGAELCQAHYSLSSYRSYLLPLCKQFTKFQNEKQRQYEMHLLTSNQVYGAYSLYAFFLGTSRSDSNCHDDICPANICPGDICPYQEYISSNLPDFYETLKIGSWEYLV